jgi:hypothetical protein
LTEGVTCGKPAQLTRLTVSMLGAIYIEEWAPFLLQFSNSGIFDAARVTVIGDAHEAEMGPPVALLART